MFKRKIYKCTPLIILVTEHIKKSKKFLVYPDEFFSSVSLKLDSHMTFYMAMTSNHTCLLYFIKPIYGYRITGNLHQITV